MQIGPPPIFFVRLSILPTFFPLHKGRIHSNTTRVQKLHTHMTNTPLKYFLDIMLGFPAAAIANPDVKKRTLESVSVMLKQTLGGKQDPGVTIC